MDAVITNENGICHIGMASEMTIYSATQIKEKLVSALESSNEIEISLAQVCEIDTSGLQLLALARRAAMDKNIKLHFVEHSPAILDLLDLCNLSSVFGDPTAHPIA